MADSARRIQRDVRKLERDPPDLVLGFGLQAKSKWLRVALQGPPETPYDRGVYIVQIDIPAQSEELHWLQFSPVEEHFYRRQHIDISRDVITKLRKHEPTTKLSALDRQSLSNLLLPLLKLRQACCHPQAVRGQFMSLQKTTMTMEQLLEQLISKASVMCEVSRNNFILAGQERGGGGSPPVHRRPEWSGWAGHHPGELGRGCGEVPRGPQVGR